VRVFFPRRPNLLVEGPLLVPILNILLLVVVFPILTFGWCSHVVVAAVVHHILHIGRHLHARGHEATWLLLLLVVLIGGASVMAVLALEVGAVTVLVSAIIDGSLHLLIEHRLLMLVQIHILLSSLRGLLPINLLVEITFEVGELILAAC